jgi:hypothetical protein
MPGACQDLSVVLTKITLDTTVVTTLPGRVRRVLAGAPLFFILRSGKFDVSIDESFRKGACSDCISYCSP